MRILIANRGEIARRIIRTAHRLGHATIAVFAEPDASMPFVTEAGGRHPLGGTDLATTYLSIDRLLEAAAVTAADAVHPGYGFLSERADFARAVVEAGLTWIGPRPEAIEAMGSKIGARALAEKAGVPVIPGFAESQDPVDLAAAAHRIGYPVLIKASAGGGGKGIRIVRRADEFEVALASAREESRRSFGDDRVIVERYVTRPRHIEVQVVADRRGNVFDLGTRECSVQRRYQKLLEEAPAPNLSPTTEEGVRRAAVVLAESIGYDSVGTVEFVVDGTSGDFYFLEMNTRLQVEHPVTEEVTGIDLVEMQIRAARNERLTPVEFAPDGHAVEVRINAEDPAADFAPRTGRVTDLAIPTGVRWESGVVVGSDVSPHYDPMVAKLIVHAPDREGAFDRLADALDALIVAGVPCNAGFHRWLVDQPAVRAGEVTTRFLDEVALPPPPDEIAAARIAAGVWAQRRSAAPTAEPWRGLPGFRVTPHPPRRVVHLRGSAADHDIDLPAEQPFPVTASVTGARRVAVNVGGHTVSFEVLSRSERWAPGGSGGHGDASALRAPFPGVIADVLVRAGETVAAGRTLVVLEAMKMLHPVHAPGHGVIAEVRIAVGETVKGDQVLMTFEQMVDDGDEEE